MILYIGCLTMELGRTELLRRGTERNATFKWKRKWRWWKLTWWTRVSTTGKM